MRAGTSGVVAALVAAVLGVTACAPPGAPSAKASPTSSGGSIAAFIPVAEHFVEQHRGLRFKQRVNVTYLDDSAFTARVQADSNSDPQGTARDSKELTAAHLMPAGTDLQSTENELLGIGVLGFYDPKTKELVVRGSQNTPETRHVLVHELTHALQDQWFGLDALDVTDPTRESDAYRALVEGDARRIENEYLLSLSASERRQAEGAGGSLPADVPTILAEILSFPYVVGPPFTQALIGSGGQKRLDGAFQGARPRYTAEVIHPDRYLHGQQAVAVATPSAGGTEFDRGIFGEEDLLYVLERVPGRPNASALRSLAASWRGDGYVAYDRADGVPCLRVAMALDGAASAQQLAAALRPAAGYAVDSVAGAAVSWTSCA